jgi:predicted DNA-binding transcriptional regulator YafY
LNCSVARRADNPDKVYDRKARLLFVLHLLNCNPRGLTLEAIAAHCGVVPRTVRRDFDGLEAEYGAKIGKEDNRFVLLPGRVLPPVLFTIPEAMAVFMAARLLLQQSSVFNHDIETAFTKLGSVVPPPLRDEILNTLRWMKRRRSDETAVKLLNIISQCWNERRQVRIRYWPLNATDREERVIEPYFIQPSALEHAVYIIALCRLRGGLRVFRLDRIVEARALESSYEIPPTFDANEYLNSYWSITATGEPRTVKLLFRREVARVAAETLWHGTQTTEAQMDGSAIVTMKVAITRDLVSFVLGWADMVTVLAPRALQVAVARAAGSIQQLYAGKPAAPLASGSAPTGTEQPASPRLAPLELETPGIPVLADESDARQLALFPSGYVDDAR